MVKNRLIASIIVKDGFIVQSINFRHPNVIGNAITAVDFFNTWSIDELIILDISRGDQGVEEFRRIIDRLSERCFVPLTVGGWVRDVEDIRALLAVGADKVAINTRAFDRPEFVTEAAEVFGSQCIVASIDARRTELGHEVFVDRGRRATGLAAPAWAARLQELGAGEIYLTSIDHDGARQGYDLELTRSVSDAVGIPVIAFGGAWTWQHFVDGIREGRADAVAAGNIFHFTEHSTKRAKEFMFKAGLNVREPMFYKIASPRRPRYDSKI